MEARDKAVQFRPCPTGSCQSPSVLMPLCCGRASPGPVLVPLHYTPYIPPAKISLLNHGPLFKDLWIWKMKFWDIRWCIGLCVIEEALGCWREDKEHTILEGPGKSRVKKEGLYLGNHLFSYHTAILIGSIVYFFTAHLHIYTHPGSSIGGGKTDRWKNRPSCSWVV